MEDERPPTPPHPLRGHAGGDHPPTPRRGTPNLRVTHPVGLRTSHNIPIVKERKEADVGKYTTERERQVEFYLEDVKTRSKSYYEKLELKKLKEELKDLRITRTDLNAEIGRLVIIAKEYYKEFRKAYVTLRDREMEEKEK